MIFSAIVFAALLGLAGASALYLILCEAELSAFEKVLLCIGFIVCSSLAYGVLCINQ